MSASAQPLPRAVGEDERASQQRDSLCGPFHGARVLLDIGVSEWQGSAVDQDLVAVRAGTTLPERSSGPEVPPGADSLRGYRYELALVAEEDAGTTPGGLADAISALSEGRLESVPLRGRWSAEVVAALVAAAPELGARLLANVRTGALWSSRPPLAALLSELAGEEAADVPGAEWDVGHFVELVQLIRGAGGALVVVRDSYPTLGWKGHHLQPPRAIAAALTRDDGREGGVLAVVPSGRGEPVRALARELSLQTELWENRNQEVAD
jgi:hypothetical protein